MLGLPRRSRWVAGQSGQGVVIAPLNPRPRGVRAEWREEAGAPRLSPPSAGSVSRLRWVQRPRLWAAGESSVRATA